MRVGITAWCGSGEKAHIMARHAPQQRPGCANDGQNVRNDA